MRSFICIWIMMVTTSLSSQTCVVGDQMHSSFGDIKVVLDESGCSSCHSGNDAQGGWHYDNYSSIWEQGHCGQEVIVIGDASQSLLYQLVTGDDERCSVTQDELHLMAPAARAQIESWINFGVPERCIPLYDDVRLLLDLNGCASCHTPETEWSYHSYETLVGDGRTDNCDDIPNTIPGNAASSRLYQVVAGLEGDCAPAQHMAIDLDISDVIAIRDWINSGLPQNAQSLPVVLSKFSVALDRDEVELCWEAKAEVGTSRYIIERRDQDKVFREIGSVSAASTGAPLQEYRWVDKEPMYGDNYYRLRMEDVDGSSDYSNIRRIIRKYPSGYVGLYPNPLPLGERLVVQWYPQLNQNITYLKVVDIAGKVIHNKIIFEGANYVRIPPVPAGIYFIVIDDPIGGSILERFIVTN